MSIAIFLIMTVSSVVMIGDPADIAAVFPVIAAVTRIVIMVIATRMDDVMQDERTELNGDVVVIIMMATIMAAIVCIRRRIDQKQHS